MKTTNLQDKFVNHIVYDGVSGTEAARRAGYSPASARQYSSTLLATPHIQAAIREEQFKHLGSTLASKAIATLERIMMDESAPYGARVDCAKTILDRAGVVTPIKFLEKPTSNKELSELSNAELSELIAATENLLKETKNQHLLEVVEGVLIQ